MRPYVYPPRVETLILPVLWHSYNQAPLVFNALGLLLPMPYPRLGSPMWDSELSLLLEHLCNIIIFQFVCCPPSRYGIWLCHNCAPPTLLFWLLLCLWVQNMIFGGSSLFFLMVVQQLVVIWCFHERKWPQVLPLPHLVSTSSYLHKVLKCIELCLTGSKDGVQACKYLVFSCWFWDIGTTYKNWWEVARNWQSAKKEGPQSYNIKELGYNRHLNELRRGFSLELPDELSSLADILILVFWNLE